MSDRPDNTLTHVFLQVLKRDLTLAFRHRGELANPLLFFIIVVSLFPLVWAPPPPSLRPLLPASSG